MAAWAARRRSLDLALRGCVCLVRRALSLPLRLIAFLLCSARADDGGEFLGAGRASKSGPLSWFRTMSVLRGRAPGRPRAEPSRLARSDAFWPHHRLPDRLLPRVPGRPGATRIVLLLFTVPFLVNYIIRTFAWTYLLGRTGPLNPCSSGAASSDGPLDWLLYSDFAVLVGLITSYMPFMIFPMWMSLAGIDQRLVQASWVLGRGPGRPSQRHAAAVAARHFRRGDLRLRRLLRRERRP